MRKIEESEETMENEENIVKNEVAEEANKESMMTVKGFDSLQKRTNTKCDIFTNITDNKVIFNLENHVDNLLNDFENSVIEVKNVLIKRYEKPLAEPIVNEETGEVVKDKEISMSCILIDTNNVSYATGSKIFTIQMMRYIEMFGINEKGFLIKIVKNKQDSGNKALGFELV